MLAHRIEIATIKNEVGKLILILESGNLRLLGGIVATEYLSPHSDDAVGRSFQALTVGVFADIAKQEPQSFLCLILGDYLTSRIFCVWSDSFHFGCDLM